MGIRVNLLPIGYRRIVLGKRTYFYYYGTYYAQTSEPESYTVVVAPIGAQIDALPEGYEIIDINNQEYFKLDDVYYQFIVSDTEEAYYEVVNNP